jgi:hypothetical protein
VTGIVSALETHHGVCITAQQVDDLAFAFIAPLGSEDNHAVVH